MLQSSKKEVILQQATIQVLPGFRVKPGMTEKAAMQRSPLYTQKNAPQPIKTIDLKKPAW